MSKTDDTMSPLSQAADELAALGYHALPVTPRQKAPGEFIGGRWKAMDGWTRFKVTAPTKFELGMWSNWPDANIGVVLGSPVGDGTVVIAIDLDLRDPGELASVVAAMPHSPMSKVGSKGETLFYRASPDLKSRAYKRPTGEIDDKTGRAKLEGVADFLTGNATKQTVVPPSRHPEGFNYRWLRGPVAARDLPIFGPGAMQRFEEALRGIGWEATATAITFADPVGTQDALPTATDSIDETAFSELNRAALANLSAWVPELGLFKCRPARGGYEAVATWRSSSTGRPNDARKRNLSIQQNGIKDFGSETSYSPLDLVMAANGVCFSEAYQWLSILVGLEDDTSGVIINFDLSKRTGGAKSAPAPKLPVADNTSDELPPAMKLADMAPAFFDDDIGLHEWADADCFPTGLVGEVASWICETAIEPTPLLAYAAGLTLVGTVAGRQFQGPTETGSHLYVIGAAPTGVGKDHPMQAVVAALHDAGMSNLVGPSDFTADSAVLRHLSDKPLSLCLMDEFGSFWKRINGRKSGNWEIAITRALREPWGRSFGTMRTKQYAGEGPSSQEIWWPAMSILGMTTPGEFFGALSGSDVENGMANRLLVLTTQRRVTDKRSREEIKTSYFGAQASSLVTPDTIKAALVNLRDWHGVMVGQQVNLAAVQRPTTPIVKADIGEDAAELLFSYRQWVLEGAGRDDAFGKFYSRAAEMAQRVALIHAVGESAFTKSHPRITLEHVTPAIRLVDWSLRTLWSRVAESQTPDGLSETLTAVFKGLDRRGGYQVPRVELRRGLKGIDQKQLDEALQELEAMGAIRIERLRFNGSPKASQCYTIVRRPIWAA